VQTRCPIPLAVILITNKLTFDSPTRLSELTQNVIRSSHCHSTPSLKISCKSVQPFSRNVADKETKKQRKKSPENNTPSPTGGRVTRRARRTQISGKSRAVTKTDLIQSAIYRLKIPGSVSWSRSPPKSNQLGPEPRPARPKISSKSVYNSLSNQTENRQTDKSEITIFIRRR